MADPILCHLPVDDRVQRTADFRALVGAFADRTREALSVTWRLRALPGIEQESARLAALERGCCNAVSFDITREFDWIVWRISAPPRAVALLDVFYDLPVLIASDEGAASVWSRLVAAESGPSGTGSAEDRVPDHQ